MILDMHNKKEQRIYNLVHGVYASLAPHIVLGSLKRNSGLVPTMDC